MRNPFLLAVMLSVAAAAASPGAARAQEDSQQGDQGGGDGGGQETGGPGPTGQTQGGGPGGGSGGGPGKDPAMNMMGSKSSSRPAIQPGQDDESGGAGGGSGEEGGDKEDAPRPMTIDDARANVGTLITSFMSQRSPQGFMPLKDKSTKKTRHLKLIAVQEKKVKAAGGKKYNAPATLKDVSTGQTLDAVFTVDFTGPEWKVAGMRLMPPAAAAAKKTKPKS